MYSLKGQFEKFVSQYIGNYVEEYDYSTFSIGLWRGDVVLNNLKLKPQTWDLGQSVALHQEWGHVGEVNIQVPWTQLSASRIEATAHNIYLVAKPIFEHGPEYYNTRKAFLHSLKMRELEREEQELLGISPVDSWLHNLISSATSSLLSNILHGISVEMTSVRLCVLVPLNNDATNKEFCLIRLFVDSITVEKDSNLLKPSTRLFAKILSLRGIHVEVSRHIEPEIVKDMNMYYHNLVTRAASTLIVNPLHVELRISLENVSRKLVISANATLHNVEVTPNMCQLYLLLDVCQTLSLIELRKKIHMLRPQSSKIESPKEWWKFAFHAVLVMLRGENLRREKIEPTTNFLRRKYIELYRQLMECRLRVLDNPDKYLEAKRLNREAISPWVLNDGDARTLENLHTLLDKNKLLAFRAMVHDQLKLSGVSLKTLQRAIVFDPQRFSDSSKWAFASSSSVDNVISLSKIEDDIDFELKRVLQEIRQRRRDSLSISWNVSFVASRIAFSLIDTSVAESCRTSISVIAYGVDGEFQQGELRDDETLALRVDSFRMFGDKGCSLLSIGHSEDVVMSPSRDSSNKQLALNLHVQCCTDNAEEECFSTMLSAVDRGKCKHTIFKLCVAAMHCHWDEKSVMYVMENFGCDSRTSWMWVAQPYGMHPYMMLRQQCAQLSMNKKSHLFFDQVKNKWSTDVSVQNFTICFPFNISRHHKLLPLSNGKFILRLDSLMIQSGDFLTNSLQLFYPQDATERRNAIDAFENQLKDIETKNMWSNVDNILFYKLHKSQNSSLQSFMFAIVGVEFKLLDSSEIIHHSITRIPWNIKGSLCFSRVLSHTVYPRAQCDIYTSPLDVEFSPQDSICMFDAIFSPYMLLSTQITPPKSSAIAPRIRNLSPLCKFRGNFNIDKLKINVINGVEVSVRESASNIFVAYGTILSSPYNSSAVDSGRQLATQRLKQLGASKVLAEQIIKGFDVAMASDAEEFSSIIDRSITIVLQSLPSSETTKYGSIVVVELNGVHCMIHALTYDFRASIQLEESIVSDAHLYPLLRAFPEKIGYMDCLNLSSSKHFVKTSFAKDKTKQHGKSHRMSKKRVIKMDIDGMMKQIETNTLPAFCGIVLTYTEQDSLFGWGYGGHSVKALYLSDRVHPYSKRSGQLSISIKNLWCVFSHSGYPEVAASIIPLYVDHIEHVATVRKRYTRRFAFINARDDVADTSTCAYITASRPRANSIFCQNSHNSTYDAEATLYRRNVAISLHADVESCRIVGVLDNHLLFELRSYSIKVAIDEKRQAKDFYCHWISIENVEVTDLSVGGTTHSRIVWKEGGKAEPIFVATITIYPDHTKVVCDVTNLRVLVLYRQLYELSVFMSSYFVEPVQECISPLSFVADDNSYESFSTASQSSCESEYESGEGHSYTSEPLSERADDTANYRGVLHENPTFAAMWTSVSWSVNLFNTTILLPRNSTSNDIVAVTIAKFKIFEHHVSETWSSPKGSQAIFEAGEGLYFDVRANEWKWSTSASQSTDRKDILSRPGVQDNTVAPTTSIAALCQTKTPSFYAVEARPADAVHATHKVIDRTNSKLVKLFQRAPSDFDSSGEEDFSVSKKASFFVYHDESNMEHSAVAKGTASEEDDEFQDAVDIPHEQPQTYLNSCGINTESEISFHRDNFDACIHEEGSFSRYVFTCENVSIYCSLATPLCDPVNMYDISYDHRKFVEVKNGSPVYCVQHGSRPISTWSKQTWNLITLDTFNVCVVWDTVDGQTRLLISETEVITKLSLRASMGEFYLLLSSYYDNISEKEFFFSHIKASLKKPFHPQYAPPKALGAHPEYGSEAYCSYIKERLSTWDILFVRAEIRFECSMDLNYFSTRLFSQQFLHLHSAHSTRDNWHIETTPFACITLNWLVAEILMDHEVIQVAVGCGKVEVQDTRLPKQTFAPTVLDISGSSVNSVKHGYADFDFGLKHGPAAVLTPIDIPFKFTYFGVGNTWGTCNIGSDYLNFNAKNLDMVWLLSDYFSMYFRSPEFCNPSVAAYCLTPLSMWPYGGIDTRVFVTRPHAQLIDVAASSTDCQTMAISAEVGLYYRYTYDTIGSVSMECHLHDLSAVLLKQYREPKDARGLRGTAGSGRGIRTLIEFMTVHWSYTFNKTNNYLDVQLSISPPSRDFKKHARKNTHRIADIFNSMSGRGTFDVDQDEACDDTPQISHIKSTYVHFDEDRLQLSSVPVYTPKCVSPLLVPARDFPKYCVNIVSSYEDAIFACSLVASFLRVDLFPSKQDKTNKVVSSKSTDIGQKGKSTPVKQKESLGGPSAHESLEPLLTQAPTSSAPSIFCMIHLLSTKAIVVDNVLGLHLPLAQVFFTDVTVSSNSSPFDIQQVSLSTRVDSIPQAISPNFRSIALSPPLAEQPSLKSTHAAEEQSVSKSSKLSTKYYASGLLWADYFNNMLKCWEPLVEPLSCVVAYEENPLRGIGITIRPTSAVHVNISVAMIRTLYDAVRVVQEMGDVREEISRLRGSEGSADHKTQSVHRHGTQLADPDVASLEIGPTARLKHRQTPVCRTKGDVSLLDIPVMHRPRTLTTMGKLGLIAVENRRWSAMGISGDAATTKSDFPKSTVEHVLTQPLELSARVGFSILNLTGQPIRYLQTWEDGTKQTVQYLNNNERGLLNFIASVTKIRNNHVVEEPFNEQAFATSSRSRTEKNVGHHVSLQIAGYKWLRHVQADTLGVKFENISAVLGLVDLKRVYLDWKIQNALKLVTEVKSINGGRMLQLNSVFKIKNSTSHTIKILAHSLNNINPDVIQDIPFIVHPGESFFLPIALLHKSVLQTNAKSLGYLWLAPADMSPIIEELGSSAQMVGKASYTVDPINLHQTVIRTADVSRNNVPIDQFASGTSSGGGEIIVNDTMLQLSCTLSAKKRSDQHSLGHQTRTSEEGECSYERLEAETLQRTRIINLDKLPPFCYNVDIETTTQASDILGNDADVDEAKVMGLGKVVKDRFVTKDKTEPIVHSPFIYSIVVHPPIVLENLLPVRGTFELVHAVHKRVLWSAVIGPGKVKSVHTVTMDEPILLLINLDFCLSSEGALIHKPAAKSSDDRGFAETLQKTIEGFLEESLDESSSVISSIILTDTVGQRLRLQIENKQGGGGHRNIVVYCPYWVVNTSQYAIRLREEGYQYLPAGTVTAQRDGTRPVTSTLHSIGGLEIGDEASHRLRRMSAHTDRDSVQSRVFAGRPGPLHSSRVREIPNNSELRELLRDLKLEEIVEMASMFNFRDDATKILGNRKVVAQLDDSSWSSTFTLESAGVNQVLTVDHVDKGMLEVAFKVMNAPGRIANYTKIVRFSPRFIVVNKLKQSAWVVQANGFLFEKTPIEVSAGHLRPFHLPAVFGERQLAVEVDGPWHRSVAFDIDRIGTHILRLRKYIDVSSLHHVLTRGAPEYDVVFRASDDKTDGIGIWFETDWTHEQIVIMRIKPGSLAARKTEVQVGDVLLAINGNSIQGMEFEQVMTLMKEKVYGISDCVIRLQTVEEKLRRIRDSALYAPTTNRRMHAHSVSSSCDISSAISPADDEEFFAVKVEMRAVDSSIFMLISEVDKDARPEYRVINKSVSHIIHYKQRGIRGGRWCTLYPGCSASYIWEDPFKPHKIMVRTGRNVLCPSKSGSNSFSVKNPSGDGKFRDLFSVGSNDSLVVPILFDDIGQCQLIPVHDAEEKLVARVYSEGPTKILSISHEDSIQEFEVKFSSDFIAEQISSLNSLVTKLQELIRVTSDPMVVGRRGPTSTEHLVKLTLADTLQDLQTKKDRLFQAQIALQTEELENDPIKLQQLISNLPYESCLGPVVMKQNQVVVEVIEAKGLKPATLGGTEEAYCEVYLATDNKTHRKQYKQLQTTYVNDQTLDPRWFDQIFLFDMPVRPGETIRGYQIRVKVRSKSVVGTDSFLGQADIQFASLQDEKELIGWFALKPMKSSIRSSPGSLRVSGSIKLRIQWIHSSVVLAQHLQNAASRQIDILSSQLAIQQRSIGKLLVVNSNLSRIPQKMLRSSARHIKGSKFAKQKAPSYDTMDTEEKKELDTNQSDSGRKPSIRPASFKLSRSMSLRESTRYRGLSTARDASSTPPVDAREKLRTLQPDVPLPSVLSFPSGSIPTYLETMTALLLSSPKRIYQPISALVRRPRVHSELKRFNDKFEEEAKRSFVNVLTTSGIVEVTPIQALNLPSSNRPVFVNISYGDENYPTFSSPPTAHPIWVGSDDEGTEFSQGGSGSMKLPKSKSHKFEILTKSIEVDTLNSKGSIKVAVMQENFPQHREIARLEIPIFNLLDCTCILDAEEAYEKWFPLRITQECIPTEGDMGTSGQAEVTEKNHASFFEYHACIRLQLRWLSRPRYLQVLGLSKLYTRIHIPALSVAIIDSGRAREIMQVVISDVDARHSVTPEHTESSANISWIQVDNQLPQPVSPVIVSPTPVKRPQPTLRLHVCRNNALSHEHLESYDSIELIIQELDMRLEQQTVIAVWDIIKSCQYEHSKTHIFRAGEFLSGENDVFNNLGYTSNMKKAVSAADGFVRSGATAKMANATHQNIIEHTADEDIDKLYIDRFYFGPIKINVSFIMTPYLSSSGAMNGVDSRSSMSDVGMSSSVSLFMWQVGEVVLDLTSTITDAPIKLNGLAVDHLFKTWTELASILQDHYLNSALGQMYKIVGSLDLVGNPVGLLSALGVGVRDFFYEPAHALIKSPTEIGRFGREVMKGAVSLVTNTADGMIGTATTMTRSVGKAVAALSMDNSFLRTRERLQKHPESILGVCVRPGKDIVNGVYCGIVGLVRVPYHGAKKNGVSGFVAGVGKGVAGLAAKPVVGVLDAITHTGEGFRDLVKYLTREYGEAPKRRRLANLFGPDGRLMPYSFSTAYGANMLRMLDQAYKETSRVRGKAVASDKAEKLLSRLSFKATEDDFTNSFESERNSMRKADTWSQQRKGLGKLNPGFKGLNSREPALPMIRRKSVVTKNVDVVFIESVIYTAIINRGPGRDLLVIISTVRIVVAEYKREHGGSYVSINWQCRLKGLKPPMLERSGGGTVTIILRGEYDRRLHVSKRPPINKFNDTSINISGDDEVILQLYNCLNTVIHNFDSLLPHANGDMWEEDEQNIIHIGSWQFARPTSSTSDTYVQDDENRLLLDALEDCRWEIGYENSSEEERYPEWLQEARDAAIHAHNQIKSLRKLSMENVNDNETIRQCKLKLLNGHITGSEFMTFLERELKYGQEIRQLDDCKESSDDDSKATGDVIHNAFAAFKGKIKKLAKNRFSVTEVRPRDDEEKMDTPQKVPIFGLNRQMVYGRPRSSSSNLKASGSASPTVGSSPPQLMDTDVSPRADASDQQHSPSFFSRFSLSNVTDASLQPRYTDTPCLDEARHWTNDQQSITSGADSAALADVMDRLTRMEGLLNAVLERNGGIPVSTEVASTTHDATPVRAIDEVTRRVSELEDVVTPLG